MMMINPDPQRIKVAVDYADPLVAIGLSTVLSQQFDIDLVEAAPGAGPHIVVADYSMGLRLAARARGRTRERALAGAAKVLVVTSQDRENDVRSALEAGVDGYLALGCQVQELISGVRQLARGSRYLCASAAQRIAESMTRCTLTEREQQVLCLVARGKSNKAVAQALAISVGTVKAHMKAILGKLGALTRTEAASIATERGLLAPGPLPS